MKLIFFLCALGTSIWASDDAVRVHQDFSSDPKWEGVNNRVEAEDPPTITQNFGYRDGKIGGVIWRSRTPAWYAMKVGPFSFDDALTASGTIVIPPRRHHGEGAYFGFFNSTRQEWRAWSSM